MENETKRAQNDLRGEEGVPRRADGCTRVPASDTCGVVLHEACEEARQVRDDADQAGGVVKRMKALVRRTSDCDEYQVREFESLEECLKTLKKETNVCEYVVENAKTNWDINKLSRKDENVKACEWYVEIYNGFRE